MRVTLIGNQNSGKTTLFNLLTGSNQKVGNWPGVTIERKSGKIKGTDIEIVDLPGIYSLSPYTAEEEISRNYIIHENPDLIINIIDATSIERSLYLTTQLLELDADVILALNMEDLLEKKGIKVNVEELSKQLGVKIVSISALKETGIEELINTVKDWKYVESKKLEIYPQVVEEEIKKIENKINIGHCRFSAVKILERDEKYQKYDNEEIEKSREKIEKIYNTDTEEIIASLRYDFIVGVRDASVNMKSKRETVTDKLDKVFLNKWAAIPIFALIMFLIYILSVGVVGSLTVDLVDGIVSNFSDLVAGLLETLNASNWFISLVCDGMIAGVGAMLNFIPQLIIMFICISLLEVTCYMNRISFFLDRVFKKFGLSGKSLIPFIVGVGCSVPGIMASRTVEDDDEKKMTIVLTPFIPCSAKLPIISLFAGFFFPQVAWLVSLGSYVVAIIIILICGLIFKKLLFKGHTSTFITELPTYKLPSASYVLRDVGEKALSFVKRAGTIILLCSVVIWFLVSFTWKFEYVPDNPDQSLLANFGKGFAWIFAPMLGGNISWEAAVSAIQGLVAKEQVVGSLEIISNIPGSAEPYLSVFDPNIVGTSAYFSGIAYMMFNLFSAPCFGAIGAMRHEFGSTKKTLLAIFFQTGLAWVIASLIGSIGFFF